MALKILELHHHALRVSPEPGSLDKSLAFYRDVLGLTSDPGRPDFSLGGAWMDVGRKAQIHLMAIDGTSAVASDPRLDPTRPHVALAVADIQEAKSELDRQGVRYLALSVMGDARMEQLFMLDPGGNVIELHQIGTCRCNRPD